MAVALLAVLIATAGMAVPPAAGINPKRAPAGLDPQVNGEGDWRIPVLMPPEWSER